MRTCGNSPARSVTAEERTLGGWAGSVGACARFFWGTIGCSGATGCAHATPVNAKIKAVDASLIRFGHIEALLNSLTPKRFCTRGYRIDGKIGTVNLVFILAPQHA